MDRRYVFHMSPSLVVLLLLVGVAGSGTPAYAGDIWVEGYRKSNGTWVEGHYRTAPNDTRCDNYSTAGNLNPYTGERGTVFCPECKPSWSSGLPATASFNPAPQELVCPEGFEPAFLHGESFCDRIRVPLFAHLNVDGTEWECDVGFEEVFDYLGESLGCESIRDEVRLDADTTTALGQEPSGQCRPGFALRSVDSNNKNACVKVRVRVPANASISDDGWDWSCDRGFEIVADEKGAKVGCRAIKIPTNGRLNLEGDGVVCASGYVAEHDDPDALFPRIVGCVSPMSVVQSP